MKLRKQQPAAAIQELNKAKTYFENAIRLAPKDSELLLVIALQYFMNQDKPTATGYLRRAIAVNKPATVSAINEFADGQLSEGKFDTAIDLYKFALDAAPDVAALQSGLLRAEKQKAAARKDTSKSNETRKP
jgi:tetratricopeptide (TPR) repeat protein